MLTWYVSDKNSWLSCAPANGTSDGEVDKVIVGINRRGLNPGSYNGNLTISFDSGDQTISVSMEVTNEAILVVTPTSLDFGETSDIKSFEIKNGRCW